MARGKRTCRILKEIRRRIAEANDIEYITSECRYRGDCLGTCPKCEAEVRYLEEQLRARSLSGKAVAIAGISAGMLLMSGCGGQSGKGQEMSLNDSELTEAEAALLLFAPMGEVEAPADETDVLLGEIDASPVDDIAEKAEKTAGNITEKTADKVAETGTSTATEEKHDEIFGGAEPMPYFPGGEAELLRYIREHIIYPEEALKDSIEGRVVVRFVIDTLGHVRDITVARGKHPALDREAIRVVSTLPEFVPGRHNGKKVDTWYTLPVKFKLPEQQK